MSKILPTFVCFVLLVMPFIAAVRERNQDAAMKCTFTTRNKKTVCQNGIWPSNNLVEIDPRTEDLSFIDIRIYENSTVPPLLDVETFRLENCEVISDLSLSVKFPLANFTRQISPEKLKFLSIRSTNLPSVSKSDFHTAEALQSLILDNCSIQHFHPNTLQAFVETRIFGIIMSSESYLTSFPWYSLQYISHSLKGLILLDWPELETLEVMPENHCTAENWTLPYLKDFRLRNVRKLSTIPGEVIRTLVRHDGELTFVQNNASCYDCTEMVPLLLQWLRTPDTKRILSFGCWDKESNIVRGRELAMPDPFCEGLEKCITGSMPGDSVVTTCANEIWSGISSPVIHVGTERLILENITTHTVSALPPIAPVPHLTELHIIACLHKTFKYDLNPLDTVSAPFPIIALTVNLKNSPVRFLRVEDTRLHSLNYSTFASFSKLESLILKNCRIPDIHPDTFRAFDVIPEPDSQPQITNNLQHFTLESNRVLSEFDWNWLAPLESSLKTICLLHNTDLLYIHFAKRASPNFMFRRLLNVSVIGNSVAHELPLDVLETMNHHSSNTTELNFASNSNPCSQCGAFPALAWAIGLPPIKENPNVSRTLRYSCINDTGPSTVTEDQDLQRELYSSMKDECLVLFLTTIEPFTDSYFDPTTETSESSVRTTSEFCCTSTDTADTPSTSATIGQNDSKMISVAVGCAGTICLIGSICIYVCKRRKLQYHRYTDGDTRQWIDKTLKMKTDHSISLVDQYSPEESATKMEVASLVVTEDKLQLTKKVLGRGSQGTIVEGVASGLKFRQGEVTVAVKTFNKETLSSEAIHKMFVEEISAMCHAGFHSNLVNLLGVTTVKKEPALLLEFCEQGALLTFLEDHRAPFYYCHVDEGGNYLSFDEKAAAEHQAMANQAINGDNDVDRTKSSSLDGLVLSTRDLFSFSYQTAKAMEYLAHRTIIHRDLAARNVLVTRNRLVKVSDFGLARKGDNVYVMGSNAGLPVRWMPPEAMLTRCFSQSSDVWSYGVLLWELFSLGEMPYNDFTVLHGQLRNFVRWLQEGHRLARPSGTPAVMYEVMAECWATDSVDRPTFTNIRENLDRLISKEVVDQYLQLTTDAYTSLELTNL